jgi:hypothetical protein
MDRGAGPSPWHHHLATPAGHAHHHLGTRASHARHFHLSIIQLSSEQYQIGYKIQGKEAKEMNSSSIN